MFRSYLKVAFRNLFLKKGISSINIAGLAMGLASFTVICLYVQYELSYDRYNIDFRRIYRVVGVDLSGGKTSEYARTPAPLAGALRSEFPEIANTVRLFKSDKVLIGSAEKKCYEENVFLADPSILSVFTFPMVEGDPLAALKEPRSIILTQETARKYFGNTNPSGQLLRFDNGYDLKVTGVLKDIPANSHLHFDFLVSMSTAIEIHGPDFLTNPVNTSVYTYVVLNDPSQADAVREGIPAFIRKYYHSRPFFSSSSLVFQPLSSIHLYSDLGGEVEPNGDVRYVYIFSAVAILILLMACINYMNILTAQYADRTREIGVRKVLGADRLDIIKQFVGESTFTVAISTVVALALVELILPIVSSSIGRTLTLDVSNNPDLLGILLATVVLTGVMSAGYPSLVLSSLHPVQVLRKSVFGRLMGLSVMRVLIVFQFLISTSLIVSTVIISQQLDYIRNTKLGFDKENVVVLPLREESTRRQCETLKKELLKNKNILCASASSVLPGEVEYYTSVAWNGIDFGKTMDFIYGDEDFMGTYKMELVSGRGFSKNFVSDTKEAYILNEAAVSEIGWKQPIGQKFGAMALNAGTVIGVVRDFNYKSLHEKIKPLFLAMAPGSANYLSIRIRPGDIPSTLSSIRNDWNRVIPGSPFEYFFFDSHLDRLYKSEFRLGGMFNWFSGLAIAIASLGLFGMVFISTAKRKKEIGIRRVFGAPAASIVGLISKEFLLLVTIASISAWPLTWYAMTVWLRGFAYRIDPGIWSFVAASSLIVVNAMIVVTAQAMRAAARNPVESLRYE